MADDQGAQEALDRGEPPIIVPPRAPATWAALTRLSEQQYEDGPGQRFRVLPGGRFGWRTYEDQELEDLLQTLPADTPIRWAR